MEVWPRRGGAPGQGDRRSRRHQLGAAVVWAFAGLGLAQKSHWEVAEHLAAGRLATVLDAFEPDPASFFAIHPVSRSRSRKVALFVEELAATVGEIGGRD